MNMKKKEKTVLRKEGLVHVLDLYVKVPTGATEIRARGRSHDQPRRRRERRKETSEN